MLDNAVIEVAIGLTFIYCIYSLFVTIINEIIASAFSLRAFMLKHAIRRMLTDENEILFVRFFNLITGKKASKTLLGKKLFKDFFKHPLIKYMSSGILYKYPSYISPENFSKVLVDILKKYNAPGNVSAVQKIKNNLEELGRPDIRPDSNNSKTDTGIINISNKPDEKSECHSDTINLISSFLKDAKDDLNMFIEKLEKWFNDTMDRASGWYKRQTQLLIITIGFIIAVGFNVNTFEIVNRLSKDKTAREQLINIAEKYERDRQATGLDTITAKRLDSLAMTAHTLYSRDVEPVNQIIISGWRSWDDFTTRFPGSLLGCFMTALAISLGAPFWFDLLSKLIKLRGTGTKPSEEKEKESSSDG